MTFTNLTDLLNKNLVDKSALALNKLKVKIFDPNANENPMVLGGSTTKLLNFTFPNDPFYHKMVEKAEGNHWVAPRSQMLLDKPCYETQLTHDEREAYSKFLSFLIFMDSIQVNNLVILLHYTNENDFVRFLSRQIYEESNHSHAYSYMLNSMFDRETSDALIYRWRKEHELKKRMNSVTDSYQKFIDDPTEENFVESIVANYLLEGIYFYNGFMFFHSLADRGLMLESNNIINLIKRDELIHCSVFAHAIKSMFKTRPELLEANKEKVYSLFQKAFDEEVEFFTYLFGDRILNLSVESMTEYTKHLINKRLKMINFEPIFPETQNPFEHLERQTGLEESKTRINNFETKGKEYQNPAIFHDFHEA